VYSMDGDVAPLGGILNAAACHGASVVVDEAHGLGVYGRSHSSSNNNNNNNKKEKQQQTREIHQTSNNNKKKNNNKSTVVAGGTGVLARMELEDHPALACSVHTFGKAAGCHGAVVCGSFTIKNYLWNYGYPLIYSTALPLHSLVTIHCAYETMTGKEGDCLRESVYRLIRRFRKRLEPKLLFLKSKGSISNSNVCLIPSTSPIQALMIPGNTACTRFCQALFQKSQRRIRLYPIKSPTVPVGQERVRIVLHAHNTDDQVEMLVKLICLTLVEVGITAPHYNLNSRL